VRQFAESLLSPAAKHKVTYGGDPLSDFTLTAFLDRFSYRNPKATDTPGGKEKSKMGGSAAKTQKKKKLAEGKVQPKLPHGGVVNSEEFIGLPEAAVRPEDIFFHKYFTEKQKRSGETPGLKEGENDVDEGYDDSDPDESAFAGQLAQQLIDAQDKTNINSEDEDPDTSGWGDLGADLDVDVDSDMDSDMELDEDFQDDDDDDDDSGGENIDEGIDHDDKPKKKKKKGAMSDFASAEEFNFSDDEGEAPFEEEPALESAPPKKKKKKLAKKKKAASRK